MIPQLKGYPFSVSHRRRQGGNAGTPTPLRQRLEPRRRSNRHSHCCSQLTGAQLYLQLTIFHLYLHRQTLHHRLPGPGRSDVWREALRKKCPKTWFRLLRDQRLSFRSRSQSVGFFRFGSGGGAIDAAGRYVFHAEAAVRLMKQGCGHVRTFSVHTLL